ncbi:DUF1150 family protein [Palleronia sp.]|uniref:DUF1150 family protein n=1 Tax=Palleronia sp. TaxID=1940284 RepID=UPI0035C8586C
MNESYENVIRTPENIVYVRPVAINDLPEEIQEQAQGLNELYAVHNGEGERLALVRDRKLAFVVARQNDMAPVSVH